MLCRNSSSHSFSHSSLLWFIGPKYNGTDASSAKESSSHSARGEKYTADLVIFNGGDIRSHVKYGGDAFQEFMAWTCDMYQSLNTCENKRFRSFMLKLNPKVQADDRHTVTSKLGDQAAIVKATLKISPTKSILRFNMRLLVLGCWDIIHGSNCAFYWRGLVTYLIHIKLQWAQRFCRSLRIHMTINWSVRGIRTIWHSSGLCRDRHGSRNGIFR